MTGKSLHSDEINHNEQVSVERTGRSKKYFSKKFLLLIIFVLLFALFIRAFIFEGFRIPTGSMENTLVPGDYIIVNKAAYKFTTPRFIPIVNIELPSKKLFSISSPERNDIIVFEFPNYTNDFSSFERINYIKRVIGLPGDTLQIINKNIYINGEEISMPAEAIGLPDVKDKYEREPDIFPKGRNWNSDNYGPIVIPKKGMKIPISPKNIREWKALINQQYNKLAVAEEGSVVTINGIPARDYIFEQDYYFVLGDNRDDSMDSRYWGFVPESTIVGEAVLIYWSVNLMTENKGFLNLNTVRFNRVFKFIE